MLSHVNAVQFIEFQYTITNTFIRQERIQLFTFKHINNKNIRRCVYTNRKLFFYPLNVQTGSHLSGSCQYCQQTAKYTPVYRHSFINSRVSAMQLICDSVNNVPPFTTQQLPPILWWKTYCNRMNNMPCGSGICYFGKTNFLVF
jgi:hypothetical protein